MKIDHIGIAVQSLEEGKRLYGETLGAQLGGEEVIESEGVRVAFYQFGDSRIELLEPINEDSPVAKFIEKRGPGVHHVALEVEKIDQLLETFKDMGLRLIDEKPRLGSHGLRVAFVHPKAAGGVLLELCEKVK